MKKNIFLLYSCIAVLTACTPVQTDARPQVVTSFYPITYFTQRVAGDFIHISQITPIGVEPHDYFLETEDLKQIEEADLIIAQGGIGLETWSEDLYRGQLVEEQGRVLVFSQEMDYAINEDDLLDSHVWLDPVLAQEMVTLIADYLSKTDPAHSTAYKANADILKTELASLDLEIVGGLMFSLCDKNKIIVTHDAFSYFSKRYGLETLPILNSAHFDEPSLEELKELADYAEEFKITAIFMETLENPEVATVLAEEAGLTTLILNPLEGLTAEEKLTGEDYFSIMRRNLSNLKLELTCP